jgi:hypothetical protein
MPTTMDPTSTQNINDQQKVPPATPGKVPPPVPKPAPKK